MKTIDWILALALTAWSVAAISQSYPNRPVRMVVPFTSGTGIYVAARPAVESVDSRITFHDTVGTNLVCAELRVMDDIGPVLGDPVHAFASLRRSDVSTDELRAYCLSRLSNYRVPESFTLTTEPLPGNANGKLMKPAMRDHLGAPFTTPLETTV